ncbi:MAG: VENN motif pre-toxin domain-containing protein, partial [Neisseriaceae bacterium]|nr:VENN motif pre-toxin domain-containing protein [Neisseriaceae bacterium]
MKSMQDTMTYNSKQQQGSVDVTIGYGFSGSASYSQSKINADYASVNEQSGIFAGEDGYQINVKNHTDLKGGIITSTQNAENNGKNRFETGTLSFEDLANKAEYKGEAIGIGVSGSVKGENSKNPNSVVADKTGMSNTMGYGRESDKQYATTHSGINTANIIIRDNEKQQQITGMSAEEIKQAVKTDITTDNYAEHSGSLKNVFDAEKVQNKIDLQVKVTKEFRSNVQDFQAKQNKRLDELKEKKERGEISEQEYEEQAKKIELQKLITNVVAGGLLAPSDSVLGVATSTLAPAASYQVGQYFKEQGKEGSFEHIATHAVLGALTYAANGTNALTGAISAGGAEAATPIVAKVLYGKDNSQNLTADEKETVVAVTTAIGTLSGGAIGDSSANAYIGNTIASNAVANNWLTAEQNIRKKEIEQLLRQKLQLADLILGGDIDRTKINALMKELRALEKESADNDRQLEAAINSCIDYLSCDTLKKIHWDLRRELSEKGWAKFEQDRKN